MPRESTVKPPTAIHMEQSVCLPAEKFLERLSGAVEVMREEACELESMRKHVAAAGRLVDRIAAFYDQRAIALATAGAKPADGDDRFNGDEELAESYATEELRVAIKEGTAPWKALEKSGAEDKDILVVLAKLWRNHVNNEMIWDPDATGTLCKVDSRWDGKTARNVAVSAEFVIATEELRRNARRGCIDEGVFLVEWKGPALLKRIRSLLNLKTPKEIAAAAAEIKKKQAALHPPVRMIFEKNLHKLAAKKKAPPAKKPAAKKTKTVTFVAAAPKAVVTSRQTLGQYEASVKSLARQEGLATWVTKEGPPVVADAYYAKKTVREAMEDYRASLPPKSPAAAAKPAAAPPAKLKEEQPPADAIGDACAAANIGLGEYTGKDFLDAYTAPSDIEAGKIKQALVTTIGYEFAVVGMKAAGGGGAVYGINKIVPADEWSGPRSTLRENRRGVQPGRSTPLTGIAAKWDGFEYVFTNQVHNVLFPAMKLAATSSPSPVDRIVTPAALKSCWGDLAQLHSMELLRKGVLGGMIALPAGSEINGYGLYAVTCMKGNKDLVLTPLIPATRWPGSPETMQHRRSKGNPSKLEGVLVTHQPDGARYVLGPASYELTVASENGGPR